MTVERQRFTLNSVLTCFLISASFEKPVQTRARDCCNSALFSAALLTTSLPPDAPGKSFHHKFSKSFADGLAFLRGDFDHELEVLLIEPDLRATFRPVAGRPRPRASSAIEKLQIDP